MAVCAVLVGVRAPTCNMPVPNLILEVFAARYASGVAPSNPQASGDFYYVVSKVVPIFHSVAMNKTSRYFHFSATFLVCVPRPLPRVRGETNVAAAVGAVKPNINPCTM